MNSPNHSKNSSKGKKQATIIIVLMTLAVIFVIFIYSYDISKNDLKSFIKTSYPNLYANIDKYILDHNTEIHKIIQSQEIPVMQLQLSRSDIAHFSDLYQKYENPQYGVNYYAEHNKWRKAELKYGEKKYKIKIKAHGRQPDQHRRGKFISYAIKLKQGEQINKTNRFNLIIRERVTSSIHLLSDLARQYNILIQSDKLVSVRINNWEEKLYYFEHRLNNAFMESMDKPLFMIFGHSFSETASPDRSLVYPGTDFSTDIFHQKFMASLISQKIPKENRESIFNRYLALNQDILHNNYDSFHQYFDLDYITSFETIRSLMAFSGHGFLRSNLYVFYDSASNKFYPALTRDNNPTYLNYSEEFMLEDQLDSYRPDYDPRPRRLSIFHLISQNDVIRQEKYHNIYQFIVENQDTILTKHRDISREYEKMHVWGWLKIHLLIPLGLLKNKDLVSKNIVALKKYIEHASPEIIIYSSLRALTLEFSPNSMSALQFTQLLLPVMTSSTTKTKTLEIKINITSIVSGDVKRIVELEGKVPYDDNVIDMTSIIRDFRFSDALGNVSQLTPRKYIIVIEPILSEEDFVFLSDIKFNILNVSTGANILPISLKNTGQGY